MGNRHVNNYIAIVSDLNALRGRDEDLLKFQTLTATSNLRIWPRLSVGGVHISHRPKTIRNVLPCGHLLAWIGQRNSIYKVTES